MRPQCGPHSCTRNRRQTYLIFDSKQQKDDNAESTGENQANREDWSVSDHLVVLDGYQWSVSRQRFRLRDEVNSKGFRTRPVNLRFCRNPSCQGECV